MTNYKKPLDIISVNYTLPEGYDSWGLKSTRPDLTTYNDFQWPFPGNETAYYPLEDHNSSCPCRVGDGLCVATTYSGMASGGFPARTMLLVAYRKQEARGDTTGKLRVPRVAVVALVDGEALIRGGQLSRADLRGAHLRGADLRGANLRGADLYGADLRGANLYGADLHGADLHGADLYGADLRGADLRGANLRGADLSGADLYRAYLYRADREYAKEQGALL